MGSLMIVVGVALTVFGLFTATHHLPIKPEPEEWQEEQLL